MAFQTENGVAIPSVTEDQMREVDRIAEQDFGLSVLQMMENAGRNLSRHVIEMKPDSLSTIVILAGSGGNGGGGICCARHLRNHGRQVDLALSKPEADLMGSAAHQWNILHASGFQTLDDDRLEDVIASADLVVDALLGYSLKGEPRGKTRELIELCNAAASRIVSLDMPSGMMATTGETPGSAVNPERVLTLALPKAGLNEYSGELYLADIGIPPEVFQPLDIRFKPFFGDDYWIKLESTQSGE
jgi:NAD(P)H-hydrate epimerase